MTCVERLITTTFGHGKEVNEEETSTRTGFMKGVGDARPGDDGKEGGEVTLEAGIGYPACDLDARVVVVSLLSDMGNGVLCSTAQRLRPRREVDIRRCAGSW